MRKKLLLMLMAAFAVSATAQTSIDTALDMEVGTNQYDDASSGYWKYTSTQNEVVTIAPASGSYVSAYAEDGTTQLSGITISYPKMAFPASAGSTIYFNVSGSNTPVTFEATVESYEALTQGKTEDDPQQIVVGETMYFFPVASGYQYYSYATYTSTETGALQLSSTGYATVTVNGSQISLSSNSQTQRYEGSVAVEEGKTYNLTFQTYGSFMLTTTMTHPEPGSLDMPFALVEGENTVPAEYGDYWYVYTNTATGYGVVSSDEALAGGQVSVFNSYYSISSNYTVATSSVGSFDTRFEMAYTGTTYYIHVSKVETTDADQTFTFTAQAYQPGDQESNPIVIESLPATETLASANGTYYYAVDMPAGAEAAFLNVTATSDITSASTSVAIYMQGASYNATTGNSSARREVSGGTSGQRYIIRWISNESTPITFSVELEEIAQGDNISNPLPAVLGDNVIPTDGTKYYTYTATLIGKMIVTATPEMTISFPRGTGPYDGVYTATQSGVDFILDVTAGTTYYIKVDGATANEVFVLTEREYQEGESRDNPIITDGTFTLGSEVYSNSWLQYTAERAGVLEISCDVPFNYSNQVLYGKSTDAYVSSMATGNSTYFTSVLVNEGDTYLVNLRLTAAYENCTVTFTIRDVEAGESPENPIVLLNGVTTPIPVATRTMPVWCVASLEPGDVNMLCSGYMGGYWYEGKENALAGSGSMLYLSSIYDENYNVSYTWTTTVETAGDYYFKFDSSYATTNLTLTWESTDTGIEGVETDGKAVTVSNGRVSVNADNADVSVYNVAGSKVMHEKISGNKALDLAPGLYIVKVNGTVKKVTVK